MPIFQAGDVILNGEFRLEALIGAGAFAEVYRATHIALKAPRAIKVLRHDAPGVGSTEYADYAQRFQLEAQLGAQLDSPHVIRVYDFRRDGEMLLLIMEYASGGSLTDRIERARKSGSLIAINEVIKLALEITEGLSAIHALDVVHRDLKPSNILFDAQNRAKVGDLGLAQVPGGPSMRSRLSQSVPHPGTPAYMSPEQENSNSHLAPASDIYALGAVLFETLTGRVVKNVRPGTAVNTLRPEVSPWLNDLLARTLADNPRERPWDGAEISGLLQAQQAQVIAETQSKQEEQEARQNRQKAETAAQIKQQPRKVKEEPRRAITVSPAISDTTGQIRSKTRWGPILGAIGLLCALIVIAQLIGGNHFVPMGTEATRVVDPLVIAMFTPVSPTRAPALAQPSTPTPTRTSTSTITPSSTSPVKPTVKSTIMTKTNPVVPTTPTKTPQRPSVTPTNTQQTSQSTNMPFSYSSLKCCSWNTTEQHIVSSGESISKDTTYLTYQIDNFGMNPMVFITAPGLRFTTQGKDPVYVRGSYTDSGVMNPCGGADACLGLHETATIRVKVSEIPWGLETVFQVSPASQVCEWVHVSSGAPQYQPGNCQWTTGSSYPLVLK